VEGKWGKGCTSTLIAIERGAMALTLRVAYQEDDEGCLGPLEGLVEIVLRVVEYSRGGGIGEIDQELCRV
jgi:hypothetical protein